MAKRKTRRIFIFVIFKILSFFIYLLPIRVGLLIGRYIGRVTFYILKRERNIALENLDIAYGNSISMAEKRDILIRLFENLGKNSVEIVSLSKFDKKNIDRYIECKRIDILKRFADKNKGGIVLSCHLGNWELLAHYFAIKGFNVNIIARKIRLDFFEKFLYNIRKANRINVIYRDESAKEVMAVLKRNEFVGIMPDQDIDSVSGVFVDFFERSAYTPIGPAVLSFLTGAPIIPCFIVRMDSGKHEVIVEEPISLSDTRDKDKDILENTSRYTKVIENYIRRFPSQWVWFHERWKTRPSENLKIKMKAQNTSFFK